MTANEGKVAHIRILERSLRGVGLVALAFSLAVGVFLALDWIQGGQARTVRSDELSAVLLSARQTPGSAVAVEKARQLDQLARHAYFSSVDFQHAGIWLLVGGLLAAFACLNVAARLAFRISDPRQRAAEHPIQTDRSAQRALLIVAAGSLALLAVWRLSVRPPVTAAPGVPIAVRTGPSNAIPAVVAAGAQNPLAAVPDAGVRSNWFCFRGPLGGISLWTNAPVAWDGATGAGALWKTPLDKPGFSSPVLWGGRIYLTEADEKERAVLAFDAATGAALWRQVVADGGKGDALPKTTPDTGLAAASASCDASGVYAIFGTGDLAAYSPEGKLRWQVYLRRPANSYGHASSLVVEQGRVLVQYDQSENGRLLALDAATGRTLWEQARSMGTSWSSPVVVPGIDGKPILVINGSGQMSGYDLLSGKPLWDVEGVSGEVAPSVAYWDGRLYAANANARLVCYRLAATPEKVWEYTDALPDVASPVTADGLLYMATSGGQLVCLDAADGKEQWKHDYDIGFYASPIVCGDRVYALDREGTMRIVATGRAFREIASPKLGEAADATPAFADDRIVIRTRKQLWCVGTALR